MNTQSREIVAVTLPSRLISLSWWGEPHRLCAHALSSYFTSD